MPLISKNPATGETLATFDELTAEALELKLEAAHAAFLNWRETHFEARALLMKKLGNYFREHAQELGKLATLEMGKVFKQSVAEVQKCATACVYYADNAQSILAHELIKTEAQESYVEFDPLGPVLAVMPWNFPFWQVARFAAPALMAGNVGLLKHASNVPQCAQALEKAFLDCGFPVGVFQNLAIGSSKVEGVIRDRRVMATTLTGSERAGIQVAMQSASVIKKTVLELGGSDPFIVLEDADIEKAVATSVTARLQNAGQSCIAAKRFILVEPVAERFMTAMKEAFESQVVGDPMDQGTTVGPMASRAFAEELHDQVRRSVAAGATVLTGGEFVNGPGAFYRPTILAGVEKGMPAYHEELFGPVAVVITVKDANEAIAVANDTDFGLGASLWTRDLKRAAALIPRIGAGAVFVNAMVKSDARMPFGGTKKSGFGRELGSYGIKEFVNVKTVWIQ